MTEPQPEGDNHTEIGSVEWMRVLLVRIINSAMENADPATALQAMRELRQLSKASSPEDSRSTSVTAGAGKLDAARGADW